MTRNRWRLFSPTSKELRTAFRTIRADLGVPARFPRDVLNQAEDVAQRVPGPEYEDRRDIEFVTIDPPSSMDLDQAVHIERHGDGYRVHYAIADLGFFVDPDSPLDQEVNKRGLTVYGPDQRTALHPPTLSEGAASLLPNKDRPAALWTIDLDATGEIKKACVRRALVRSRAKMNYEEVQRFLDNGTANQSLSLLKEVGLLRQKVERERGGVSLEVPEQEVEEDIDGDFSLLFRKNLPVEGWNAQISLLTGIAAAQIMKKAGIGILRTLPPAAPIDIKRLRATARALGIYWPKSVPYAELLRNLDSGNPKHAAFMNQATTLFRGAGYLAFDKSSGNSSMHEQNHTVVEQNNPTAQQPVPSDQQTASSEQQTSATNTLAQTERQNAAPQPKVNRHHAAIAAEYAHVTAPLRRLVDRYGTEICLAYCARKPIPQWVLDKLPVLPEEMSAANRQANALERRCANVVEASLLRDRIGEVFNGVVVDRDERPGKANMRGEVMISSPAVLARIDGEVLELGEPVKARLIAASVADGKVLFESLDHPPVAPA
ncbi:MAG: RNB domain-containing ribonuclease [Cellulomonadaceae bacterium]|jgi:exoribonuclease R|nr:RNB domain-containing ribonuclease [Cellulomonadaceae bacterium]